MKLWGYAVLAGLAALTPWQVAAQDATGINPNNDPNGRVDPRSLLRLSKYTGIAPLKVRIIAPPKLMVKSFSHYTRQEGCEYIVDWGDGTVSPDNLRPGTQCDDGLKHLYRGPGYYTLQVKLFHATENHTLVLDWTGTAQVIVQ